MRDVPQPTGALAEMLARDGVLDELLDGRGLQFTPVIEEGPPPEPAQPFFIPPPPWSENYIPGDDDVPDFVEADAPTAVEPEGAGELTPEAVVVEASEPEAPRPRGKHARLALRRPLRRAWQP